MISLQPSASAGKWIQSLEAKVENKDLYDRLHVLTSIASNFKYFHLNDDLNKKFITVGLEMIKENRFDDQEMYEELMQQPDTYIQKTAEAFFTRSYLKNHYQTWKISHDKLLSTRKLLQSNGLNDPLLKKFLTVGIEIMEDNHSNEQEMYEELKKHPDKNIQAIAENFFGGGSKDPT